LDADRVTAEDLERGLTWAAEQAPSPQAGLFGPGSASWSVDREAILFLSAGRALLMQLAHPWVAQGVLDHSRSLEDPFGRFHRTFSAMFSFVFGSLGQAFGAARRLHRRHEAIRGALSEGAGPFPPGSFYCANHLPALRWVLITLTDGAVAAHEAVLPPLAQALRDRYVAERALMGAMFGIPPDTLPRDWDSFVAERDRRLASEELTVTPAARQIAERLVIHPPLPIARAAFRNVTAHLLPERMRIGYGLTFGAAERRDAERTLAWLRRLYPKLPAAIRQVGPYREAKGRLAGRPRPTPFTRALNRFWIGAPALPEGDQAARFGSDATRRGSSCPALTKSSDTELRQ
jgi:uncharacterized protein (DUF2236 family)